MMPISVAHSFLVYAGKNLATQPTIAGATLKLSGPLYEMLEGVYSKAESECKVDISFNPTPSGKQQNDCRDLIVSYARAPSESRGMLLAERLQSVTTNRSGLGLLFLMTGTQGATSRVVISRFPADSGVLADATAGGLTVEFIERVFMKSATSYKSALYVGKSFSAGFWDGKAVDKQINDQAVSLSDYWIRDFLISDFRTTAASGTRRLATVLRTVVKKTASLEVKDQILAAARLSKGMDGRRLSISTFVEQLSLSDDTVAAIRAEIPADTLFKELFQLDATEFSRHLSYQTVELDNGAMLTAYASEFEQVFTSEILTGEVVKYSTQGRVIDKRLKAAK